MEAFGQRTAEKYHRALHRTFELLSEMPAIGREDTDHQGYRRFWHGRHVIFYREEPRGIVIARLLHVAMDAARHPIDPENED